MPAERRLRTRRTRLLSRPALRKSLVSLTQIRSLAVLDPRGAAVGKVRDVVVRWDGSEPYPLVTGLVLDVGGREAFASTGELRTLNGKTVALAVPPTSLRDFARREGELRLVDEVLHCQIVDVDGVRVLRAEELWLGAVLGRMRLVAVQGVPGGRHRFWGTKQRNQQLVDWAGVQPVGDPGSQLRLRLPHEGMHRLRPGELADLLESLDRAGRDELTASLDPGAVADALEEMEPERIEDLLRDVPKERAAELVAAMEPDEAADALRDLDRPAADAILTALPPPLARQLSEILAYPESMAGGFMTTNLARASANETVAELRERLARAGLRSPDIDGVVVVDDQGQLLADLNLLDLFLAPFETVLADLVGEVPPVAVRPEALLDEVVDRLTEARRPSVVVVDEEGRPLGRVLADDVIDALREGGLPTRLPWLFH